MRTTLNLKNFNTVISHHSPLQLIYNCLGSKETTTTKNTSSRVTCAETGMKEVQRKKAGLSLSSPFWAVSSPHPAGMESSLRSTSHPCRGWSFLSVFSDTQKRTDWHSFQLYLTAYLLCIKKKKNAFLNTSRERKM